MENNSVLLKEQISLVLKILFFAGFLALAVYFGFTKEREMKFSYVQECGSITCARIIADGPISMESAAKLEKLIAEETVRFPAQIILNSRGGSVLGSLNLGEVIRKHKISTFVGSAVKTDGIFWEIRKGSCLSACVLAFAGGADRFAGENELGYMKLFSESGLKTGSDERFTNLRDIERQQVLGSLALSYLIKMGVDPQLLADMTSKRLKKAQYLTKLELIAYDLTKSDGSLEDE